MPRRRPLPRLRRPGGTLESARGIEIGHIFQLGRMVRRGARPAGARRERQAGHGHDGLLRHRRHPRRRRDRREHPRRPRAGAGRARSRRPTSTSSPPARTRRSSRPPSGWRPGSTGRGVDVLFDDRPKVSPGREVQGRRAHRRAHDRRRRARGSPTASSRSRTAPPASGSRSPVGGGRRPRRRRSSGGRTRRGLTCRRHARRRHLRLGRHADAVARRRLRGGGAGARPRGACDAPSPRRTADLQVANQDGVGRGHATPSASATIADIFTEAGLSHDEALLTAYREFWDPHTHTDPEVPGPLRGAARGRAADRRAVQHRLAPRLARGDLPPGRRPRPHRRRGLHQRDALDQAVAGGVPRGRGAPSGSRTRRGASSSATGSSTTSGARRRSGCGRSSCRTPTSRPSRSATPLGEPDAVVHRLAGGPRGRAILALGVRSIIPESADKSSLTRDRLVARIGGGRHPTPPREVLPPCPSPPAA